MNNKSIIRIIAIGIALMINYKSFATEVDGSRSIFDLLTYQEVVDITIETDLDVIKAQRRSKEEMETVLSFRTEEGELQRWKAKLGIRGKFRRVHCEVPPIRIDFKKSDLKEAGLEEYDDFEIVTHCLDDQDRARDLLLKEYLAYRLYGGLTPYSYRTQLARITYKNPSTGEETQQWGILIEDTAQLSDRIDAEKVDGVGFPLDTFDQKELQTMALFQYMIGNTDWDLNAARNVKFFRKDSKLIPIAYDFDFSGLVDAPYALRPKDSLRYDQPEKYLGPVPMDAGLTPTLRFYQSNRKSILSKARKLKLLPSKTRKDVRNYLEEFFDIGQLIGKQQAEYEYSRR